MFSNFSATNFSQKVVHNLCRPPVLLLTSSYVCEHESHDAVLAAISCASVVALHDAKSVSSSLRSHPQVSRAALTHTLQLIVAMCHTHHTVVHTRVRQ